MDYINILRSAELLQEADYLVYQSGDMVIKLFMQDASEDNNEFKVLERLQLEDASFPKPIFQTNVSLEESNRIVEILKLENYVTIYKLIIYEYITGTDVSHLSAQDKLVLKEQLKLLWNIGLLHGDLHLGNIIRRPNNQVQLIDFGKSFGYTDKTRKEYPATSMVQAGIGITCLKDEIYDFEHM